MEVGGSIWFASTPVGQVSPETPASELEEFDHPNFPDLWQQEPASTARLYMTIC